METNARTTREWQDADAQHYLHPFTDFMALIRQGTRIIVRGDNIYLWDSEGKKILDAMSGIGNPPCSCMPLIPPSDAPAIVEPW